MTTRYAFPISGELLLQMFSQGNIIGPVKCIQGLPAGAQIKDAIFDGILVILIIECEELPPHMVLKSGYKDYHGIDVVMEAI